MNRNIRGQEVTIHKAGNPELLRSYTGILSKEPTDDQFTSLSMYHVDAPVFVTNLEEQ